MSTDDSITAAGGWCTPSETVHDFGVPASMAEPIEFPAPRDASTALMIEEQAAEIQFNYPYRTLLACREIAARLVDEVLTWDAMWPEAEGDCACPDSAHLVDCYWFTEITL